MAAVGTKARGTRQQGAEAAVGGMRVKVLQENLQRATKIAAKAVSSRTALPILRDFLLRTDKGRLAITATDLELRLTVWVGAKVETEGEAAVPARMLTTLASTLPPSTVTLERAPASKTLRLSAPDVEMELVGSGDAEDFPRATMAFDGRHVEFEAKPFLRAVARVLPAAADDCSRPVLTAVYLEPREGGEWSLTTADGFRLYHAVIPGPAAEPFADGMGLKIPARALRMLLRVAQDFDECIGMSLTAGGTWARFEGVDWELESMLIQGTYPDYVKVFPETWNTKVTVPAEGLRRAVKMASPFARDGSGIIRFEADPAKGITVSSRADEIGCGSFRLLAAVEREAGKIAFNMRYMADTLACFDGDVSMSWESPSTQGVFESCDGARFRAIVMPMFVQW